MPVIDFRVFQERTDARKTACVERGPIQLTYKGRTPRFVRHHCEAIDLWIYKAYVIEPQQARIDWRRVFDLVNGRQADRASPHPDDVYLLQNGLHGFESGRQFIYQPIRRGERPIKTGSVIERNPDIVILRCPDGAEEGLNLRV